MELDFSDHFINIKPKANKHVITGTSPHGASHFSILNKKKEKRKWLETMGTTIYYILVGNFPFFLLPHGSLFDLWSLFFISFICQFANAFLLDLTSDAIVFIHFITYIFIRNSPFCWLIFILSATSCNFVRGFVCSFVCFYSMYILTTLFILSVQCSLYTQWYAYRLTARFSKRNKLWKFIEFMHIRLEGGGICYLSGVCKFHKFSQIKNFFKWQLTLRTQGNAIRKTI